VHSSSSACRSVHCPEETRREHRPIVDYQTHPSRYKHWRLKFEGPVATLIADFDENAGLRPGYKLKLNSYDLGVDIELNDAIGRIRFEHPEVRTVVVTSAKEKVFCSGANIFMLGVSSHAWKVNFCKFTNETRNGLEDSSRHSGLKFLAAVNGACAGGGYELALACDEIILIDDRSSAVSLPEVPLLGVLPGTGGLTRVTDKRHVRHDLADIFCTTTEGVRGQKAKDWRLVDDIARPAVFAAKVQERALQLAAQSDRPATGKGVTLTRCSARSMPMRCATRTSLSRSTAPSAPPPGRSRVRKGHNRPTSPASKRRRRLVPVADGARTGRRDPVDAHQRARHRHLADQDEGDAAAVLAMDATLLALRTTGWCARPSACCAAPSAAWMCLAQPVRADRAGLVLCRHLAELALACDRSYHLALPTTKPRRRKSRWPTPTSASTP